MSTTNSSVEHHELAHVMSPVMLVGTGLTLLALTAVTVTVARMDLGDLNVAIALAIAGVKVGVVATIFMHLRYDKRFSIVVFVGSIFFALFLTSLVLLDSLQYQPDIRARREAVKQEQATASTVRTTPVEAGTTTTPGKPVTPADLPH